MTTEREDKGDLHRQLLSAVSQISQAADFPSALATVLEAAHELVPCDGASAMWLADDQLEVVARHGRLASLTGISLPIGQVGAARAVLDGGRAVAVADTAQDTRWRCVPGEEQARSWLGAPLVIDGRVIGLLTWTAGEAGCFDDEEVQAAGALAQTAAPLLYRVLLLDDTRRRLREVLEPRPARAAQVPDGRAALQQLAREALDLSRARHAFAFLAEEGTRGFRCVAAAGELRDRLQQLVLRGDGTLGGWGVLKKRAGERMADWIGAGSSDREVMARLGLNNVAILPLRVGREPVGMLGVAEPRDGRSFGQPTLRLMTHLASQASLIVERDYQNRPTIEPYDYDLVFQSSPLGLCVLDVAGQIEACNPALAGLLARSDRNLVGHNLSEFLLQADWRRLRNALEDVAITGQRQQEDSLIQSSQGEQRHVRLSLARATGQGGERDGQSTEPAARARVVAVFEDVTWLKILEQERVEHLRELREKHNQLQELDQLRTRFVSNVSHELRTPLAVIKLYATLARKGRPEKQTYYLQTIEQETHRLETMVENILDLTRIDRQSLHLHPELLAVDELIGQVLEVYQETAHKRAIELKNHVPAGLPRLLADKNDLIQMLTNLVDNAIKYTPRGGQVWVAARAIQSGAEPLFEVAVGDTGVGIAPEEQKHIFERFYRGSNNSAGSTGTGLGLAIVQELMAQHGGRVVVTSQVGQGSVLALQFPPAERERGS